MVNIGTTKNDLSSEYSRSKMAFVEFTDYKGETAKGSFKIADSPLYTTIRINSEVEIEYSEGNILGGYNVFLLNPELYKRTPTPEELAPYKRNNKRVLKQSLMGIAAFFITIILYAITKSPFAIVALFVATYFIMKYGSAQEKEDSNKFLSWTDKE